MNSEESLQREEIDGAPGESWKQGIGRCIRWFKDHERRKREWFQVGLPALVTQAQVRYFSQSTRLSTKLQS
jgi:hypothetical protein